MNILEFEYKTVLTRKKAPRVKSVSCRYKIYCKVKVRGCYHGITINQYV